MLLCNEAVTVVNHIEYANTDKYVNTIIYNVSWHNKAKIELQQNGITSADIAVIRIPESSIPSGFDISPGNYIIKGEVLEEIESLEQLQKYNALRIMSVTDNRRGKLKHLAVTAS